MNSEDNKVIRLTIIGKGPDIERMQKRLRCAARATGTELQLSWQYENPQTLDIATRQPVAVTRHLISGEDSLLLDGLQSTETIEDLFIQLGSSDNSWLT